MNRIALSMLAAFGLLAASAPCASGQDYTSASRETYLHEMAHLDANEDGKIDASELAAGQQMAAVILALSWNDADLDSNGAITENEFLAAAEAAGQQTPSAEEESDPEAEQALAEAIPLSLLLETLSRHQDYADEIAAFRAALEEATDDEEVVTYLYENQTRYPRLAPVVRTWVRHYPVHPRLRKHPWRAKAPKSVIHQKPARHRKPPQAKPPRAKPPRGAKPAKPRPGGRPGPRP